MDPLLTTEIRSVLETFQFTLNVLKKYYGAVLKTSRRAQAEIPQKPSIHDWYALEQSFNQWALREWRAAQTRYDLRSEMMLPARARGLPEREIEDGGWIERAANRKIMNTFAIIRSTLDEIDQTAKQAIEELQIYPAPVRIRFRDPFATPSNSSATSSSGKSTGETKSPSSSGRNSYETKTTSSFETRSDRIPNDRTPEMVGHEAKIMRTTWLRLKSRYEFLSTRHLANLEAYSDSLEAWYESEVHTHHRNINNIANVNIKKMKAGDVGPERAKIGVAKTEVPRTTEPVKKKRGGSGVSVTEAMRKWASKAVGKSQKKR